MNEYYVQTSVGKFKVTWLTHYNYYTKNYEYEMIKLGGKKYCIEYMFKRGDTISELQWLDTDNKICTLNEIELKKDKTVHFFYLSVTILKKYLKTLEKIKFLDNSYFYCTLPDKSRIKIFLNKYNLLFHKKTWYEDKFNAYPIHKEERIRYSSKIINFTDPSKKPKQFAFLNDDLEKIFYPIYEKTDTWEDFLKSINNIDNKCAKISLWYKNVIPYILDNTTLPEYWYIDINEKTPTIQYKNIIHKGGTRKYTNDNSKYETYHPSNNMTIKFINK